MRARTIPQRELRNNIGGILREAEAGAEFTITVRGRPVAKLGPVDGTDTRQVDVPAQAIRRLLRATPVDTGFAADVGRLRELEAPDGEPWQNG
jgi:prevent-host-death family protein